MAVENNVSIKNDKIYSQVNQNNQQCYKTNPNAVDKTPDKDTVSLSNNSTAKKVGIGAAIVAAAVAAFCLLRGRKPSKQVTQQIQQVTENLTHEKPKMQMTEDAKKIYDDVASRLNKKTKTTAETVERNLAPKQKEGAWDSKDMKEYYTQFEKESVEKAAKEAEARAAKEAAEKAAKVAEAKAAKEIKELQENLSTMTPRELSDMQYKYQDEMRTLRMKARDNGMSFSNSLDYPEMIPNYLSPEERVQHKTLKEKLLLIGEQINSNDARLAEFLPTVCEGSQVPMHHDLCGKNTYIRNGHTKKNTVDKIDETFENLPKTEKEYIVYRGRTENPIMKSTNTDFKLMDEAKVGDVIVPDTAYSYTAFKRSLADIWGGAGAAVTGFDGKPTRQMMYTIHIPKGAKVSRNLEHGGEVVMPRAAEYKILSKNVDKNGNIEVELEYIIPDKVSGLPYKEVPYIEE